MHSSRRPSPRRSNRGGERARGRASGPSECTGGSPSLVYSPTKQRTPASSLALLGGRAPYHRDLLVRPPHPCLRHAGFVHPLDANVRVLAACGGVGPPDHLPLSG